MAEVGLDVNRKSNSYNFADETMLIDNAVRDNLTAQDQASPRLHMNLDLCRL